MAASYISVPRDLTKVKSKVMFNLTKRQLSTVFLFAQNSSQSQYGSYGDDGDYDAILFPCHV